MYTSTSSLTDGYEENWFYVGFFSDVLKVNKKYCGLDIIFFDFNCGRDWVKYVCKLKNRLTTHETKRQSLNKYLVNKQLENNKEFYGKSYFQFVRQWCLSASGIYEEDLNEPRDGFLDTALFRGNLYFIHWSRFFTICTMYMLCYMLTSPEQFLSCIFL